MLLKIKLITNILFTLAVLIFSINLIVPFMGDAMGTGYWPWFTTGWIIVVERWVVFIWFELKKSKEEEKRKLADDLENIVDTY